MAVVRAKEQSGMRKKSRKEKIPTQSGNEEKNTSSVKSPNKLKKDSEKLMESVTNAQTNPSISKKKHKKIREVAQRSEAAPKLATAALVLKNLPPTIDYTQLKGVVPGASRLELYKKNGKRHAFARFSTTDECSHAASKLQNLELNGYQVRVAFASHSQSKQPLPVVNTNADTATTLHLSNLPFNMTQQKLEAEFPTASRVIMNLNSRGRFRGSCLLQFDSVDDCRIVHEACRGRQIDGRPLRCATGIGFKIREQTGTSGSSTRKVFGVKVKGIPKQIEESELRELFDKHDLLGFHCSMDGNQQTKTALYKFKSDENRKFALRKFKHEKLFGVQLRAKPWSPPGRRRKEKSKTEHSESEQQTVPRKKHVIFNDGTSSPGVSKNHGTPEEEKDGEQEIVELSLASTVKKVTSPQTKSKKRKHAELDESNASATSNTETPITAPKLKKKKQHSDTQSLNATFSAMTQATPTPKSLKKRRSLAV